MSDLDLLEKKVLFILFVESKRNPNRYSSISKLASEYHVKADRDLLVAAFERWFKLGWTKRFNMAWATYAKLRPVAFGEAYKQVLRDIGGTSMSIFPHQCEVLTDAVGQPDTPLPSGWKWFEYERKADAAVPTKDGELTVYGRTKVDWGKWGAIAGIAALPLAIVVAWWFSK